MKQKKVTGLFFGSFNPIHAGHMAIANYMAEFTPMKELWFVVSPHNPLKEKAGLLETHHRLEMVHRAIGNDPRFRVCDIETRLPLPSYTIDTLTHLSEKYPDRKFVLIMGGDNLATIHKWKNPDILLRDYEIYVYPRPGIETQTTPDQKIHITEAPLMDISATFIRKAIAAKKDIRYFLPPAVWEYIDKTGIYL